MFALPGDMHRVSAGRRRLLSGGGWWCWLNGAKLPDLSAEATLEAEHDELDAVAGAEFGDEPGDVGLDRSLTEEQLRGDLRVGPASGQGGRDGQLGKAGLLITAVGVVAVVVCLLSSVLTRSENSLGPVYLLGTFASVVGLVVFAIASIRGRVLPWWAGPALVVSWVVGGPLGDGGPLGFKASALLLAAVAIAIAVLIPRTVATGR